ncbi:MAG TPA: flagellin [Candidatus Saccharimonadales bacterium]|nr:flagellin [Candidatus Saccharimonadales bacterium]
MVINTNIAALNGANNLNKSTNMLNQSLARLSSGSKIVNASDDPAGLAESISLTAQIGQTTAANQNVSNAASFAQTQDGFLQQVGSALDQMSTLAVEAQDGTKTNSERADYQKQFNTLAGYITDTAAKNFNGVSLFSASALTVTTDGSGDTFAMTGVDLSASGYTGATGADISTTTGAASALTAVATAITQLATDRATIGANEERLNYTGQELGVLNTNLSAANSQLTDVDVAQESTNYAKYQILVQSGTSMLAQANQNPQSVLKLLA